VELKQLSAGRESINIVQGPRNRGEARGYSKGPGWHACRGRKLGSMPGVSQKTGRIVAFMQPDHKVETGNNVAGREEVRTRTRETEKKLRS